MKKILLGFCVLLISVFSVAQNGLENIIVEKYYVSNAADAAASVGTLPVGSVTYRIYVDMRDGYKFQMAYGDLAHPLSITTTTSFFNNEDRGSTTPTYTKIHAKSNTVMLDSWVSVGAACAGNFGIPKGEDNGVLNVINTDGVLSNNDPLAGIPLTIQDGLIAGSPGQCGLLGIDAQISVFDATSQSGDSLFITDGAWYCLDGAVGPNADNKVLIAQVTTEGELSFKLNIQLGTPTGGIEIYVPENPSGSEIKFEKLKYPVFLVNGVSVSPTSASIVVNDTKQLTATVLPANATNKNIIWSTSNSSLATVNSSGLVTGKAAGSATITATTEDGNKTASCNFIVTNSIISVTNVSVNPASTSIFINDTQQLTASIIPSEATNQNISWNSANSTIASVSSTGLVTGVSIGTTAIIGTTADGNKSDTCYVTVIPILVSGVSILPATASISINGTQQLTTTIVPTNATNQNVSWGSDNPSVAKVSSLGLVTGISAGSATITITTSDGNKTDSCIVTVLPASISVTGVSVSPNSENLAIAGTQQLTATISPADATNKNVSWSSDNSSVATVNSSGMVTGIASGIATITVTTMDGNKTGSCIITVSSTSTNELTNQNIELYPNPATTILTIKNLTEGALIKVYDLQGRLMLLSDNNEYINVSELSNGIYYVEISNNGTKSTHKFFKK